MLHSESPRHFFHFLAPAGAEGVTMSVHPFIRPFVCLFVHSFICSFVCSFVRSFSSNLSRALILHLSSSNLQAIRQQSVSSQSVVIYQSSYHWSLKYFVLLTLRTVNYNHLCGVIFNFCAGSISTFWTIWDCMISTDTILININHTLQKIIVKTHKIESSFTVHYQN